MKNKNNLFMLCCMLPFITIVLLAFKPTSAPVKWQYCTVTVTGSPFRAKVRIVVDNGQEKGTKASKDNMVKDPAGSVMNFNSPIDAMNYMGQDGWECVTAYNPGTVAFVQFLMRKPVE